MGKFALTFSASMAIVVGFVSSLVGKFPDWVETNILGQESSLHYLLSANYKYDLLALAILATLSPQLLLLAKLSLSGFVRLAFHASYCLLRREKRLVGGLLIVSLLVAALSVGLFAQSIAVYGFAIAREYRHRGEINRQKSIETANELGKSDLEGSVNIFRGILKANPEDARNSYVQKYIRSYEEAKASSEELMFVAEDLATKKNHRLAIVYYQLAAGVIQQNKLAKARLAAYETRFEEAGPSLKEFFELCKDRNNLSTLVSRVEEFGFAVKEPTAIKRLNPKILSGDDGTRTYLQICGHALHYKDSSGYLEALKARIFNPEEEDDS